jgi:hypothetical protein
MRISNILSVIFLFLLLVFSIYNFLFILDIRKSIDILKDKSNGANTTIESNSSYNNVCLDMNTLKMQNNLMAFKLDEAVSKINNVELILKESNNNMATIVDARKGWQDSGISVRKGDVLNITARGKWTADERIPKDDQNTNVKYFGWVSANGNVDATEWYSYNSEYNGPIMLLLGKIGDQVFAVGESIQYTAETAGKLYFAPNDLCCLGDNGGLMTVTVSK